MQRSADCLKKWWKSDSRCTAPARGPRQPWESAARATGTRPACGPAWTPRTGPWSGSSAGTSPDGDKGTSDQSSGRHGGHEARRLTCRAAYLVGGCVQVGEGDIQQVVLQCVDPRGDRQLQCFYGFVNDFLTEDAVESAHAVTCSVDRRHKPHV